MLRTLVATMLLVVTASPAFGKLEVDKVEACYGRLGPVRKTLDFYLYDEVIFRYAITGAKANDGTIDVETTWSLLDAHGKKLKSEKLPFKGVMSFGTDTLPNFIGFFLPETASAGEYVFKLHFRDNVSGEETGFERKLKLKETEFAIVSPQFFFDDTFKVHAPVGGVVGQALHFRMWTIGFDRGEERVINDVTIEIFDKEMKATKSAPFRFSSEERDEDRAKKISTHGISGWMALSKPGEFNLRVTVTDRNSKKTAIFEAPMKVTAP